MNRDVLMGIGFFLLMAAGGAFLVWMNWTKIGTETGIEDAKNNVQKLMGRIAVGRTRLEQARVEKDAEKRKQHAREAHEALTQAVEIDGSRADLFADRAEANAILGDPEAARRDLDRAKKLQPERDWTEAAKRCGL